MWQSLSICHAMTQKTKCRKAEMHFKYRIRHDSKDKSNLKAEKFCTCRLPKSWGGGRRAIIIVITTIYMML